MFTRPTDETAIILVEKRMGSDLLMSYRTKFEQKETYHPSQFSRGKRRVSYKT